MRVDEVIWRDVWWLRRKPEERRHLKDEQRMGILNCLESRQKTRQTQYHRSTRTVLRCVSRTWRA